MRTGVFVGGVLCTLSAWVIGFDSVVVRVRAGAEVTASPRLANVIPQFYGKANCDRKETPGPAPTGKGVPVVVRLQPPQLSALDAWIGALDASLTRPEAIRAMMETILHILSKDRGEKPAKKAKIR
jgi:hypothetical protein